MKRYVLGCLVLFLLGLVVVGCGGTTTVGNEKDSIQKLLDSYAKCMVDADVEGVLSLHDYPYVYERNNVQETFDKIKLESNTKSFFEQEDITQEKLEMINYKRSGENIDVDIHFYKEYTSDAKYKCDAYVIFTLKNFKIIKHKCLSEEIKKIDP